jgi:biopolymer transport protein TolR
MARERKKHEAHDEEPLDLDVTPFLNILFMLILSILAMTAWTQMSMLNVQAPEIGGGGGGGAAPETVSKLNLTVIVLKEGFNIGASGATLDGGSDGRPSQPLVLKTQRTLANGQTITDYDYPRLQQKLIEIKKSFPNDQAMIISADGSVTYETIVRIMDVARKTADGTLLFPAVAFAAGVVG